MTARADSCHRGHEYTPENTARTTHGVRYCMTCDLRKRGIPVHALDGSSSLRGAACMRPSYDPEWWFSTAASHRERARNICGTCPVMLACYRRAVVLSFEHEVFGIWAGLVQAQLRRATRLSRQRIVMQEAAHA